MKFSIERSLLLKSLSHVQSVVEKRNTIPVLSNVKLEAASGVLKLKATDMDLEIQESVPANVSEKGVTTASAHMLYDIVRKLPEGSEIGFTYSSESSSLSVEAGRSKFSLSCLPAEDFPAMSVDDLPFSFNLSAEDIKNLIDRTKFAVSTEETRYYLNGIFFHTTTAQGNAVMRSAATDGHRLACMEIPLPKGAENMPSIILPRKTVTEIRKLIDETDSEISISLSETMIKFAFADVVLASKLIDGNYPDYERVIPQDNNRLLDADVKQLAHAVDRVSIISEKSRGVKVVIKKGSLTISASSPEAGSASEEIDVLYDSDSLEIGFNYRYMLDILQEIKGDTVRFSMSDAASPTVITDIADKSAVYVLMPMRV